MTARLLASVLAILMGSPTCWCCVPHDMAKEAAPRQHSCCHRDEDEPGATSQPVKGDKDKCPCSLSQTKRDVAADKIQLPQTGWSLLAATAWQQVSFLLPVPVTDLAEAPGADESPPWRRPPLYAQNCARLL